MNPKTVMPEVLPDPELAKSLADGDPRARTRNRLRRLAQVAASAAGGVGLAGCVGYGVVDPLPPPSSCAANATDFASSTSIVGAVWQAGTVVADLSISDGDSATQMAIQGATVSDGQVQVEGAGTDAVHLVLTPTADADLADVALAVVCSDNAGGTTATVTVRFYVSGPRIDGTAVSGIVVPSGP